MSEDIRPALTADEWRARVKGKAYLGSDLGDAEAIGCDDDMLHKWLDTGEVTVNNEYAIGRLHALAALCLYQQPFGFEQEDVDAIEDVLGCAIGETEGDVILDRSVSVKAYRRLESLQRRIAALLPPEPR